MTLLANINLKDNPNLIRLLLPGETLEARRLLWLHLLWLHLLSYTDYSYTHCGRAYPVGGEILGPSTSHHLTRSGLQPRTSGLQPRASPPAAARL